MEMKTIVIGIVVLIVIGALLFKYVPAFRNGKIGRKMDGDNDGRPFR